MKFSFAQTSRLVELLREAARLDVLPRFRRLDAAAVRRKTSALDLVTDADEAAERRIAATLGQLHPGCLVIGEQAASANPALLGALGEADLCFVVDPVDGTANFAAGLPLFGVMVAVIRRGEVVAGVILDPIGDDAAVALRGEGAWIEQADGRREDLRVADPVPPAEMSGAASWRYFAPELRDVILRNLPSLAASWDYRCAAHQYRMLAQGHCHYQLFNRLLPWDHAAGWLLHREAGGYSARLDGRAYLPADSSGGLLCAPDAASWVALREVLLTPGGEASR